MTNKTQDKKVYTAPCPAGPSTRSIEIQTADLDLSPENLVCEVPDLTPDSFSTGAKKQSSGKLPYHLIPKEMFDAAAEGLNCGLEKGYEPNNWQKGLPIMECHIGPAMRHIMKYASGKDINQEYNMETGDICTPLHHLCNAFVHIGMAITQIKRGRDDLDDREKP